MTDTLVERLEDQNFAGPMQHLRDWKEIDGLFAEAAFDLTAAVGLKL